jgi:hypothetical protein
LESHQGLRVFRQMRREKFKGNETSETNVLRFIDDTHSTTEFLDDAVMRDRLADERVGNHHSVGIIWLRHEVSQRSETICCAD